MKLFLYVLKYSIHFHNFIIVHLRQPAHPLCVCSSYLDRINMDSYARTTSQTTHTHQRWICTNLSTLFSVGLHFSYSCHIIFFCAVAGHFIFRTTIDHCKYRNWQWKKNNNFPICLHNGPNPIEKKKMLLWFT